MPRTQRCCAWCNSKRLPAAKTALFYVLAVDLMQLLHFPPFINLCKFGHCICPFVAVLCTRVSYCMWSDCAFCSLNFVAMRRDCVRGGWWLKMVDSECICLGLGMVQLLFSHGVDDVKKDSLYGGTVLGFLASCNCSSYFINYQCVIILTAILGSVNREAASVFAVLGLCGHLADPHLWANWKCFFCMTWFQFQTGVVGLAIVIWKDGEMQKTTFHSTVSACTLDPTELSAFPWAMAISPIIHVALWCNHHPWTTQQHGLHYDQLVCIRTWYIQKQGLWGS
jgi:hypothetical protein